MRLESNADLNDIELHNMGISTDNKIKILDIA